LYLLSVLTIASHCGAIYIAKRELGALRHGLFDFSIELLQSAICFHFKLLARLKSVWLTFASSLMCSGHLCF